jgi:hypothetical protein
MGTAGYRASTRMAKGNPVPDISSLLFVPRIVFFICLVIAPCCSRNFGWGIISPPIIRYGAFTGS